MSDAKEFCGILAGRLSHVMLPHDQEMPAREIERVVDEHLAETGGLTTVFSDMDRRITELEKAIRTHRQEVLGSGGDIRKQYHIDRRLWELGGQS